MVKRIVMFSCLLVAWPLSLHGQLIAIRTVPISQEHQFRIFPSATQGVGDVSIAVEDSLLDPFVNPAKGARLNATRFFGTPSLYSVSNGAGGGRTLPIGTLVRTGSWHGGVVLALQEVDLSEQSRFPVVPFACPECFDLGIDGGPLEQSHGNTYLFATLGRALPLSGWSVGGSIQWASLNAVDGVDLLYPASARLRQFGDALDLRLGVLKEWDGGARSLEAIVLHNRYGMTHDVTYLDGIWDPGTRRVVQQPRVERNLDRSRAWGLHLEYQRALTSDGWRIGWLGTANRMSHPKIPNYEIMNIPRDPGNSSAFNVGVGVSRNTNGSMFAVDLVYEPIWSHTWSDSESPVETATGDIIAPGGMIIENRFRFHNALFRLGVGQEAKLVEGGIAQFQFGLVVRSTNYRLAQTDHVQLRSRGHEEQWVEWTPTWGLGFRFPDLEVSYRGRVINGTGRPGVIGQARPDVLAAEASVGSNILVAPSGPLTLAGVTVVTHQFSIAVPLR